MFAESSLSAQKWKREFLWDITALKSHSLLVNISHFWTLQQYTCSDLESAVKHGLAAPEACIMLI